MNKNEIIHRITRIFRRYTLFFRNIRFKKKLRAERKKLYGWYQQETPKFHTRRNKYKLFTLKLHFDNASNEIKNLNTYYIILGVILILASIYLAFFSQYFQVKNINIVRQDDLLNINMAYRSVEGFRYKPIFLTNTPELEQLIVSHQPNIIKIQARKLLPDTIQVIAESSPKVFVFKRETQSYAITKNGVLVPTNPQKGDAIIEVKGFDTLGIVDYKKMFNPLYIQRIQDILKGLANSNSFVSISHITYYKKEQEIHILTKKGTLLIFDLNKEINIQIQKLNIFYKSYFKKIAQGIIYIDLRINERVIYCDTSHEFQCKKNLQVIYE